MVAARERASREAAQPACARPARRRRMGGARSCADGSRTGTRGHADSQASSTWTERSRLLGDQRGFRRPGARVCRGMERRELLPRTAPHRRDARYPRPGAPERRWWCDCRRPSGGGERCTHRTACAQGAGTARGTACDDCALHRRRSGRCDAARARGLRQVVNEAPTAQHWRTRQDDDGILWVVLDKADSSTNVLSSDVLVEANALLEHIERKPPRAVVITSAKKSGFIAGADVKEFAKLENADQAFTLIRAGQSVFDRIEALPCPTIALMNGFALG